VNRTATNPHTGSAAYSVFADVNGDGRINALDLSAVKQRLNSILPAGAPATLSAVSPFVLRRRLLVGNEFFGSEPIAFG